MKDKSDPYLELLSNFSSGKINANDFQHAYLERFKSEPTRFDESTYDLLDTLFAEVDAYTTDQDLLRNHPGQYLDELALKASVDRVIRALWNLKKRAE